MSSTTNRCAERVARDGVDLTFVGAGETVLAICSRPSSQAWQCSQLSTMQATSDDVADFEHGDLTADRGDVTHDLVAVGIQRMSGSSGFWSKGISCSTASHLEVAL
ncbi:MAG: hypothetical protein JWM91_1756, partial [Rhodospirillales bacterium]|nr:hypothetical protein [Rhodospirillales bacterium]